MKNDQLPGPEDAASEELINSAWDVVHGRKPPDEDWPQPADDRPQPPDDPSPAPYARSLALYERAQALFERGESLRAGDSFRQAETAILQSYSLDSQVQEDTRRSLADMRQKLAQPADGGLERLLIERAALSCAAVNSAEKIRAEKWQSSMSFSEATFWDRHVSTLNGDFLKACRALADVRRLARPTVLAQMNIAEKQQINVSVEGEPVFPDPAGSGTGATPSSGGDRQTKRALRRRTAPRET